MHLLPWIAASLVVLLLAVIGALLWALRRRAARASLLPAQWSLTARPVFSAEERRAYRLLREALPHHVILSKLPLVRFCQPADPAQGRYWYGLLGTSHVALAVCGANGRVLAAIDLDTERADSPRQLQIKQAALSACRVRYLRCPAGALPSTAELQLLVPQHAPAPSAPQPASRLDEAHVDADGRRAARFALWQHDPSFGDSFFAPDSRPDERAFDRGHPFPSRH